MSCNSVEEIFENIDRARARLEKGVSDLGDGGESFRDEPGRWTIAEIVEHLSITEGNVVKLCRKLLDKAEAEGHARPGDAPFPPASLAEFAEHARQKFTAPATIAPTGRPLPESLAALRDSRAALHALRPRLDRVEGTAVRFPHPAFGPINLYQWLLFIGAHELRHLAQIEAVKQAMHARADAAN